MDLGRCTRCIFITWALLIIVCQTTTSTEKSDTHNANGNQFSLVLSGRFTLRSGNMLNTVYFSHRALFLTLLGTLCLALLSCAGYFCCFYRLLPRNTENLDAYAPRTQSIVWPQLPETTARVVELIFLHAPGAVDCLCSTCELARENRCMNHCSGTSTDC